MPEVAPGLELIDTRLGGREGITAAYLARGARPALIETGARTSADAVSAALAAAGLEADDLALIVLTHIHLDHCGASGLLARRFPRAQVIVHRRGARHLVEPDRLIAGSAQVYGETFPLYGGLDPIPAERVTGVEDGYRVDLGEGRTLVMVETLGHARHHMSVLDESSGAVMAGDALGVMFAGAGLYQALPPPDIDLERADASLRHLEDLAPTRLLLAHFGPVPEPAAALAEAREQVAVVGRAALAGWRRGRSVEAVTEEVEAALPLEETVGDPGGIELWRWLRWGPNTPAGLAAWAAAQEAETAA